MSSSHESKFQQLLVSQPQVTRLQRPFRKIPSILRIARDNSEAPEIPDHGHRKLFLFLLPVAILDDILVALYDPAGISEINEVPMINDQRGPCDSCMEDSQLSRAGIPDQIICPWIGGLPSQLL